MPITDCSNSKYMMFAARCLIADNHLRLAKVLTNGLSQRIFMAMPKTYVSGPARTCVTLPGPYRCKLNSIHTSPEEALFKMSSS